MNSFVQVSKRREIVDCFNCSASHRPCDRTRHRCGTCSESSDICQGYPRELQWLTGVTSRGKQKGQSISIGISNREWQSTIPTNHNFVFKQGKLQKRRKQESANLKAQSIHKPSSRKQRRSSGTGRQQTHHPRIDEVEVSPSPTEDLSPVSIPTTAELSGQLENFETLFNEFDSGFPQSSCDNDDYDAIFSQPTQSELPWWPGDNAALLSLTRDPVAGGSLTQSLLPTLEHSQLLTLYNTELCTLPLTFDFPANPFRCRKIPSQGSTHLLHALLALSMQHVSRMNDVPLGDLISPQIMAYKHSATELCTTALLAASGAPKNFVLDTLLVLFALDTLVSATGPWNARLSDAYRKIESIGGMNAVSSSPRSRAQLAMFIWWDCSIALLARSESVFPPSYYDFVLSCDDDASWNICTLSGVPPALFQYCRELIQLASEKEQISRLKYAIFDMTRVLELECCIQEYTEGDISHSVLAGSEEMIECWHDYYNASNAWKYALLLYIARVLKWDRNSSIRLPEITSLSRLVLDSVRCCRPESALQKQLLFPIFIAGSESQESYSRSFVKDYCEEWYRKCRYNMFRDASTLLEEIWSQRDLENNDFRVWWGGIIGSRKSNSSEFLFG